MAYGSVLTDVVQSSTAGTPPQFNDGNGTQTGTLCRAWVNFNGTGTVAIRASFNVSSITDNGTGNYTVNFTTALSDANYSAVGMTQGGVTGPTNSSRSLNPISLLTTSVQVVNTAGAGSAEDSPIVCVSVFR